MADDRVSLATAVSELRREIAEASRQARGLQPGELKFRITSIELELTVVAEDSATVGGEVGWWVFKGKAEAQLKDAQTHKVKLSLNVGDLEISSPTPTA